jgi:energy-coupling factor transport system permease protein
MVVNRTSVRYERHVDSWIWVRLPGLGLGIPHHMLLYGLRTRRQRLARNYYFSTRQLLTIAMFSCLGAVLSTYVGYIGAAFGSMTGIPIGGQLFTGLHALWITLVLLIVDKKGAALLAAILNNILQFLMGSHLGILVLLVGLLQGVCAELGYWPFKRFSRMAALVVAGGLSAWSNLWVQQAVFNRFGTLYLFWIVSLCAVASGVVFGRFLPYSLCKILQKTGLVSNAGLQPQSMANKAKSI